MSALLTRALRAARTQRTRLGLRGLIFQAAAPVLATRRLDRITTGALTRPDPVMSMPYLTRSMRLQKMVAGAPCLRPQQRCSTGVVPAVVAEPCIGAKHLLPTSAAYIVNFSRGLAGHSKYHNTKHRKARQDASKRSLVHQFSGRCHARDILVAAAWPLNPVRRCDLSAIRRAVRYKDEVMVKAIVARVSSPECQCPLLKLRVPFGCLDCASARVPLERTRAE
eukprot:1738295-Pleurochrysis_carterae.AAC.1